jgi:tRNA nucleotidyltransferase (CCA-adding enzyme)
MHEEAPAVKLVSAERIGGGVAADGMGELSKLLLGAEPARALRIARDIGVLVELLPEFAPAIGFDQESRWHDRTVDEHTFAVVQATADADGALRVRLSALLHDLGKPVVAWRGRDGRLHFYGRDGGPGHEEVGADLAARALSRLRYPNDLRSRVVQIVRHHMLDLGRADARRARKLLARHGEELAFDLVDHKEADLRAKPDPDDDLAALARFRAVLEEQRTSPHRLADLAVDGNDLIGLGYRPGPELGRTLDRLLGDVVGDPALNRREWLLERAKALQP